MVEMTMDPIQMLATQIKAKAAKAAAAGKMATATKTTTPATPRKAPPTPEMYNGKRPDTIVSKRETYLKSIESGLLKEAADLHGVSVKFGINPKNEGWKSTDLQENWDKIVKTMADLKASRAATNSINTTLPV